MKSTSLSGALSIGREDVISIKATRYFSPKSEDSTGDVEVDPEVMELFRGYRATASGDFVIESRVSPRPAAAYSHYRCQREFEALNKWLQTHGVEGSSHFTRCGRNMAAKSAQNMASTLRAARCATPTLRLPVSIIWTSETVQGLGLDAFWRTLQIVNNGYSEKLEESNKAQIPQRRTR